MDTSIGVREAIMLTTLIGSVFTTVFVVGGVWALLRYQVRDHSRRLDEQDAKIENHEHRITVVEAACSLNHPVGKRV